MAYTTNYMPNTNQGYDYGVGVFDQQQRDEEERRRLAALAAAAAGAPVSPDAVQVAAASTGTALDAGNLQMVGGKLRVTPNAVPTASAPESQAVAPQAPMVNNAESLRAAQMAAAGQAPQQAMAPEQQPAFLPEAGQFASTEQQTQDMAQSQAMDQFLAAQNDPMQLMSLAGDTSQPEAIRKLATEQAYKQLTNQRQQSKAEQDIKEKSATGDFRSVADSIRGGRKGSEEGSWARYIMLKALDNDAAKVEGSKLGLFDTWTRSTVVDPTTGQQKIVQVLQSGTGKLLRGTDLQGNDLTPEELNSAAVATNYGKAKPEVIGNVEKDGMAGRIVTTFDAQNRPTTMVESGGKMYPYDTTWKARDISAAATKDTFRATLALAQRFGTNVLDAEKQYEIDSGPFGSAGNPMTREEFRRQYDFSLGKVPGMSTGTPAAAPAPAAPVAEAPAPAAAPTVPVAPAAPAPAPAAKVAPVKPQAQPQAQPITGGGGTVSVGTAPKRQDYPSQTAFNIAKERYDAQQKLNNQIAAEAAGAEIQRKKEMRLAEEKPGAAAKGEQAATDVKNQGFADRTYGLMKQIDQEIRKSTGSSLGAGADTVAAAIGSSTEGSKAIARLNVLSYGILSNIPRFEGPQSDIDVQMYKQAAGDFNNRQLPIEDRLAALGALNTILQRYDKAGKNDWTYGTGGSGASTGTTSSGNKYKKVQ